jgi:hypothetical protein
MPRDAQLVFDTIVQLADDIARTSPESADKATRIVGLLRELNPQTVDPATIADAIDAQSAPDLSDSGVSNAASAVLNTLRDPT